MSNSTIRSIVVDIDSTLYPMLPVLAACARQRFGVSFRPEDVDDWDYWAKIGLTLPQWLETIDASHVPAQIVANKPFPGALEAIHRWAAAGAAIHVVSDRKPETFDATRLWLSRIGMPKHHLALAPRIDKVAYVLEHKIDLVIDDKPSLIAAFAASGVPIATIAFGYNRAVIAANPGRVISAPDWPRLSTRIDQAFSVGKRAS